jgi:hypothetical protein
MNLATTRNPALARVLLALTPLLLLAAGGCATAGGGAADPARGPADAMPEAPVAPAGPEARPGARPGEPAPAPAAGLRIAELRLEVEPSSPRVGDTARVTVTALDTTGAPLEGVDFQVLAPRRLLDVPAGGELLVALREGRAVVTARPVVDGAPLPGAPAASVEVTVRAAPLARLEIAAPERLYVGTRAAASVTAHTAFGPREETPAIEWRSGDPSVARVSESGTALAVAPGASRIEAVAEGMTAGAEIRVVPNPIRSIELAPSEADVLVGEVVHLSAAALGGDGTDVEDAPIAWSVGESRADPEASAQVEAGGAFVANAPGTYRVFATVGEVVAESEIRARPRPPRRDVSVVGHHPLPPGAGATTDLWVFEGVDGRDYAYTGTLTAATMYAWDVTNPATPELTDSLKLDGRRVNDVKINEAGTIAVVTSEGASDRRNGITLLDILDPAHPRPITHFTEHLTGGVHNVWIEGDLVYAVHNGTRDLHIVDISEPSAPRHVGRWGVDSEGRVLHDVIVKDGFAYLSYWDDGLVILDVGAGIAGGTPTDPQFVSRHVYSYEIDGEVYGNTHHAIRYRDWVFVADEIFGCAACVNGPRGYVHVIDVADIEHPVEVAFYRVPEAGAHNMWVEDDRLYVAYYQAGARIVDVSGELRGDLWRQGREIGWFMTETATGDTPNATMAWGPQPYKGSLFVSDLNSGLWVLRLGAGEP